MEMIPFKVVSTFTSAAFRAAVPDEWAEFVCDVISPAALWLVDASHPTQLWLFCAEEAPLRSESSVLENGTALLAVLLLCMIWINRLVVVLVVRNRGGEKKQLAQIVLANDEERRFLFGGDVRGTRWGRRSFFLVVLGLRLAHPASLN